MRVALIGPYPPPYGGVSTHIQRMKNYLDKTGISCMVYDIGSKEKKAEAVIPVENIGLRMIRYLLCADEDIIHYHGSNWVMRTLLGAMGFLGKKVIVTNNNIVSLKESLRGDNPLKRELIKYSLREVTLLTGINKDMYDVLISTGIEPKKIKIITSFIPPVIKDDCMKLPKKLLEFVDTHRPLISAGAFQLTFYDGIDVYGLDLCVDLIEKLTGEYPKIGLIFCLPIIKDDDYFSEIVSKIRGKCLENNILIYTEALPEVTPIWANSDVFVRPTYVDGEGISIKEALSIGTPVVTSDACERPKEAVVFKNRNITDFVSKVREVLSNLERYKGKRIILENGAIEWVKVYKELMINE